MNEQKNERFQHLVSSSGTRRKTDNDKTKKEAEKRGRQGGNQTGSKEFQESKMTKIQRKPTHFTELKESLNYKDQKTTTTKNCNQNSLS